ncbi:MAG: hypothetical protein EA351_01475 [Gemmatimonadales bacterium]|nr:MAG: hypothetical protein EA351_01475 [Gemmatimonadales bacterium]
MARGVRKQASKGGGPLDLFDDVEITYDHRAGRDLHTLREHRTLKRRGELGSNLLRFAGASFLSELILTHTMEEGSPRLHDRLTSGLDGLLACAPEEIPGRFLAAGWGIVAEFGFPPELDRCVHCNVEIPAAGMTRFDLAEGGLRCPECAASGIGPRLGPGARTDLRAILAGAPPSGLRGAAEHFHLLERFALHHLDRRRVFQTSATLGPLLASEGSGDPTPEGQV